MKGLIFTYGMTALGAVASLFDPFTGLLVYVCFAIVRPDFMWRWSVPQEGRYSFIVGCALIVGWFLKGMGTWKLGKAWYVVGLMAAYWAWAAFSNAQGLEPEPRGYEFLTFLAKVFVPFLVGVTTVTSVARLKQLAWVIVLSNAYVAYEMNLY